MLRSILVRLSLVAGSVIATLLAIEGALRLAPANSRIGIESARPEVMGLDSRKGKPQVMRVAFGPAPKQSLVLIDPDPDPAIKFRGRPGVDAIQANVHVRTNSLGFRGPELRSGTWRIVTIGDSVMFGGGVEENESYVHLLEKDLARDRPDVEVVNMAVPGYNTSQEVALLARHVALLQPSWVIVGFQGNDYDPIRDVLKQPGWIAKHSFLYRLLALRWRNVTRRKHATGAPVEALHHLADLAAQNHFKVFVFLYAGFVGPSSRRDELPYPEVSAACKELGFPTLEMQTLLVDAIAAGEIHDSQDIWLSKKPSDPHPKPMGHAIIGRGLARAFREAAGLGS